VSVIAITGVSGCLGSQLVQQTEIDDDVEAVIGLDVAPFRAERPAKLELHERSVTEPFADLFRERGVDVAIHLAHASDGDAPTRARQREVNVEGTRRFLEACDAAGVRVVCFVSCAMAYGARPENAESYLYEGSLLEPNAGSGHATDAAEMEALCYGYISGHPDVCLQIVRPTTIIGPHARNHLTRMLAGRFMVGPAGDDPPLQLVHEDDATRAIYRLVKLEKVGVFNLAADGALTLSQIARLSERRLVRLPRPLLWLFLWLGWRLGFAASSPALIPYLVHPWLIAPIKVKAEAMFMFRFDAARAFLDYVEAEGEPLELGRGFLGMDDDDVDDIDDDELDELEVDGDDAGEAVTPLVGTRVVLEEAGRPTIELEGSANDAADAPGAADAPADGDPPDGDAGAADAPADGDPPDGDAGAGGSADGDVGPAPGGAAAGAAGPEADDADATRSGGSGPSDAPGTAGEADEQPASTESGG